MHAHSSINDDNLIIPSKSNNNIIPNNDLSDVPDCGGDNRDVIIDGQPVFDDEFIQHYHQNVCVQAMMNNNCSNNEHQNNNNEIIREKQQLLELNHLRKKLQETEKAMENIITKMGNVPIQKLITKRQVREKKTLKFFKTKKIKKKEIFFFF